MRTTTDNLVYYDTNIWAAWILGESDLFSTQAQTLIEGVTSGKNVAAVSDLVLLETIHVIRKKVARNSQYTGDSPEDHAAVQNKINAITQDFIGRIREMARKKQVLIIRPKLRAADHHARVLAKFEKYFGHTRTISRGSAKEYRYKGLGHTDFEHAFLAHSYGVKEFYSADKSFEDLKNDPDFAGMRFNTVESSQD